MVHTSRAIFFLALLLVFCPLALLIVRAWCFATPTDLEVWDFIRRFTLPGLFANTFALMALTVLISLVTGFLQAILVVLTDVKGRTALHALFVLPLAFPLYILSYIYVGALEYSGPLPSYLRNSWGLNLLEFINIKHPLSVAMVFSLSLSPYVYLFQKSFLERIDRKVVWSARALGQSPWKVLFSVLIPQSKTCLIAAAIFIGLEVLCDFGAVSIFNFETFSTAIYEAWSGLFSFNSAMRVSTFPMLLAILLYGLGGYVKSTVVERENKLVEPLFSPGQTMRAVLFFLVFGYTFLSLIFPLGQLLVWAISSWKETLEIHFFTYLSGSFILASICGILVAFISLIFAFFDRFYWEKWHKRLAFFLKIGYALPGSLVGVGVMAIFAFMQVHFFGKMAFLALLLGLCIRFYAVGFEMNHKAYAFIHQKLDWMGRSQGLSSWQVFRRVHFPILKPAFLSSILLCFLEVVKEMPVTLILRPYGINTLATKVYELTSEGEWERTSFYALSLICLGLGSVLFNEFLRKKAVAMSFLKLQKVSFSYQKNKIVENFNLNLKRGEIHCLLGPSGCGKSTILHLIAGFLSVDSGQIKLENEVFDDGQGLFLPPEKRGLGVVFQESCLFPHLNVEKNIYFGVQENSRLKRNWLELIGLAHKKKSYPQELSGGEQQRVAIARAMVSGPRVLLMDEPFSSLDEDLRAKLRREVKQLLRSLKLTALIVTHSHKEAFELGDRITLMGRPSGHCFGHQTGHPQDFFFRPQTSALVEFMNSGILLKGRRSGDSSVCVDGLDQFEISNSDDLDDCLEVFLFVPFHHLSLSEGDLQVGTANVASSYSHGDKSFYLLQREEKLKRCFRPVFFEMQTSGDRTYKEGDCVPIYLKNKVPLRALRS